MNRTKLFLITLLCWTLIYIFPALAQEPSLDGPLIAFMSIRDGKQNVYVMNTDGSGQTNMTDNIKPEEGPTWSPDGLSIAFSRQGTGEARWDLMVVALDGTRPRRLTSTGISSGPTWSPDGDQIAFNSRRIVESGRYSLDLVYEVFKVSIDGHNERQLSTRGDEAGSMALYANWSPDGTQVAYTASRDSVPDIYVVSASGGREIQITETRDIDVQPVWSPDSQHIAFLSRPHENADWDIFVMDSNGENVLRLTDNDETDNEVSWSPDGQSIAFVSDEDGNAEIYTIRIDGSAMTNLTNHESDDYAPVWSPDGQQIAFVSNRDGDEDIYVMNADGTNLINLTDNDVNDWDPSWQPVVVTSS